MPNTCLKMVLGAFLSGAKFSLTPYLATVQHNIGSINTLYLHSKNYVRCYPRIAIHEFGNYVTTCTCLFTRFLEVLLPFSIPVKHYSQVIKLINMLYRRVVIAPLLSLAHLNPLSEYYYLGLPLIYDRSIFGSTPVIS